MRDFLNRNRRFLHALIGFSFTLFLLTLVWDSTDMVSPPVSGTFADKADYYAGIVFVMLGAFFFGSALGAGIEEFQLRHRKTNLGFDLLAIAATAYGGAAAGVMYFFTADASNDTVVLTVSGLITLAVAAYYFWDDHQKKKAQK